MSSRQPRTIKLGTVVYFWRTHHRHDANRPSGEQGCTEVFTAFHERYPRSPLRILFPETDEHGADFPRLSGVVVDYREPTLVGNLNRPGLARRLIELAVAAGWEPSRSRREFVVSDGYRLMRENRRMLDVALE
jgi:hypothetical protein